MHNTKTTLLFLSTLLLISCGGGSDDSSESGVLKKTGQTDSYDTNGTLIRNGTLKDDGYYQRGATPHYTRDNALEIVTDHITGLEWQDTPEVATQSKSWLSDEVYAQCHDDYNNPDCPDEGCDICYDTSGDTAINYCASLELDGGGWRLPTMEELFFIVDKFRANPSINPIFQNINDQSRYFTSNTLYTFLPVTIYFDEGYSVIDFPKVSAFSAYVRCVRGESKVREYNRNENGIVQDLSNKIAWQDDYSDNGGQVKESSWQDAINYCESLDLNGSGWRVPNIHEAHTLSKDDGQLIEPLVERNMTKNLWSSTTYRGEVGGILPNGFSTGDNTLAWVMDYTTTGYVAIGDHKEKINSVRCVRDIE